MSAIYNPWQQTSQLYQNRTNQSTEANSQTCDSDPNKSQLNSNISISQSEAATDNISQSHAGIEISVSQPQMAIVTTVNPLEVQEGQKFTVHKPIFFPVYKYF